MKKEHSILPYERIKKAEEYCATSTDTSSKKCSFCPYVIDRFESNGEMYIGHMDLYEICHKRTEDLRSFHGKFEELTGIVLDDSPKRFNEDGAKYIYLSQFFNDPMKLIIEARKVNLIKEENDE